MKTFRTKGDIATPKKHPELKSKIIDIKEDFRGRTLYVLLSGGQYVESELK